MKPKRKPLPVVEWTERRLHESTCEVAILGNYSLTFFSWSRFAEALGCHNPHCEVGSTQ